MAQDRRAANGHNPEAIAKAHAIYTPAMLSVYDLLVHGFSNRFAWRCPTQRLIDLYRDTLSPNHLEAGVGTGFFIERSGVKNFDRLVLLDINRNCLELAARRLVRWKPALCEASLFDPAPRLASFDSIGLTYVLHCLPGTMLEKLEVIDRLRPLLAKRGVLFGATILGSGIAPNRAARSLLALYNARGVFHNLHDDFASLDRGLRQRFDSVQTEKWGLVTLFRAS